MLQQIKSEVGIKVYVVASDTGVELKTITERMYKYADIVLNLKNGYVEKTFGAVATTIGKPFQSKMYDEMASRALKNTILKNGVVWSRTKNKIHQTATNFTKGIETK
jgi:alkylated DNA nucleotide flippase Atl1